MEAASRERAIHLGSNRWHLSSLGHFDVKTPARFFETFLGVFFSNIAQNSRPGRREAPQSISFDETSRIKSVWARWIFGTFFVFVCKTQSARC